MAAQRSRWNFVFQPQGEERNLSFMMRGRFALLGANGISRVTEETHPDLYATLEEVSQKAGMATPRAYIWHSRSPLANAVAMPSAVPTIAFSESITQLLNTDELAAVTGHELGHVKNLSHSGKLYWLSAFGGMAIGETLGRPLQRQIRNQMEHNGNPLLGVAHSAITVARFAAPAIGGAVASRSEEYAADRHGAYTMEGDGVPLLSALQKLGEHNAHYSRPTLLGKILAPFSKLTSSHPEFEQRRNALGVTREEIASYRVANADVPAVGAAPQPVNIDQSPTPQQPADGEWQRRVAAEPPHVSGGFSR